MARSSRTRSRSFAGRTASAIGIWTNPVNETYNANTSESCSDSYGSPVVDSPLVIQRLDRSNVGGLNGTVSINPTLNVTCENWLPGYQRAGSISHNSTGAPSLASLGATVLSRTNPSRPVIVPFTIVQDLYDVPRMLRDVGKLIRTPRRALSPREAANQYLGAKFGWLPLIEDARKLIEVGKYIDARVNELRRLYSAGGLKRRLQLGNNSAQREAFEIAWSDSYTGLIGAQVSYSTTSKTWATVRWKPNNIPCPGWQPSDAELLRQATQIVSGFTTEGVIKGSWDLLPWSWMVDWFGNVGDWLTQSSSTIPASPTSLNIMRETITVGQHSLRGSPRQGLSDSGGVAINIRKERVNGSGSLSASLPTLDANRLSILGALFVQRFKH